jgi:hypothetical protein
VVVLVLVGALVVAWWWGAVLAAAVLAVGGFVEFVVLVDRMQCMARTYNIS